LINEENLEKKMRLIPISNYNSHRRRQRNSGGRMKKKRGESPDKIKDFNVKLGTLFVNPNEI
jgi:hypothetical protein